MIIEKYKIHIDRTPLMPLNKVLIERKNMHPLRFYTPFYPVPN